MEIQAANQISVNQTLATPEVENAREDTRDIGSERSESATPTPRDSAVETNISTTALQASRADNVASSVTAQAQNNDIIAAETRNQSTPSNEQLATSGNQTLQTSRVDTVA